MRVLLIGVDGLTLRIVKPLMAQGLLPHLRQIYEGGAHALLRAPLPPAAITRWWAIMTGLPPRQQDQIAQSDDGERRLLKTTGLLQRLSRPSLNLAQEDQALWSLLSAWGRRVLVANVPATYPPRPLNGIMLSGPPAPPFYAGLAYPPDFAARVLKAIPTYQLTPSWRGLRAWFREPLKEIQRLLEMRSALLDLLLGEDWDCCLFVLHEIDLLQHLYWDRILDLRSDVVACYRLLDELLGRALAALRSPDLLILLSPYSFQGARRTFHLNEFLMRYNKGCAGQETAFRLSSGQPACWRGKARMGPSQLLPWLPGERRWRTWRLEVPLERQAGPSLADGPFAMLPTSAPLGGYAAIALAGHLTEGQIEEFIADLQAQVDPMTAYPAIGDLYREDICMERWGPGEEPVPPGARARSLVLLAHDGVVLSPRLTRQRQLWSGGEPALGMHHPDGLLCLYGAEGQRTVLRSASAYDIVPTVLAALKVPLPEWLAGRPLIGPGTPLASPSSI